MIIKSKHASNYTVIPNEIFKSGLRLDSIGVLAYLLSLPHDWVIYKSDINNTFKIGKEKMRAIFKDLEEKGYLISVMKHGEDGRISYEHVVYDKPFNSEPPPEEPSSEKPSSGFPSTDNTPLLNTNIPSTNKQKKLYTPNLDEFLDYARNVLKDKYLTYKMSLELKYNAWCESGWMTGGAKPKPIKNWKSTLLNTIPYLKADEVKKSDVKPTYKRL
jgi:hypothetical protein